jgi:hypothetical protein
VKDGLDDILILDGTHEPHVSPVFRANHRIDLIDIVNQSGPAFPACRRGTVGFDDLWDGVVFSFFLPFHPGDVAIPTVVTSPSIHPLLRDMRTHGR